MRSRPLLPVAEALARARQVARALPAGDVPAAGAGGLVLAGPVRCQEEEPALDLSAMDGVAVASADAAAGARLRVVGVTRAGDPPGPGLRPGCARRIMTGAPLPPGADAVAPVEELEVDDGTVRLLAGARPGAHVRRQGSQRRPGEVLIPAGVRLGAAGLSLLAGQGNPTVRAHRRPVVAVAATGDEVLAPDRRPLPWQVRNSNGPLLAAAAAAAGARVRDMGVIADTPEALADGLAGALAEADLVVLSGGVSMGDRDLVPAAVAAAGLETVFHGVAMKPGKPILLARAGDGRLVLGLPGNPLSAFVGFALFGSTLADGLAGLPEPGLRSMRRPLAGAVECPSSRQEYRPGRLLADGAVAVAPPGPSADLAPAAAADLLAVLPAPDARLPAGAPLEVVLLPPGLGGGRG